MISLAESKLCTGCGACMNACTHEAIVMTEDHEGFLQPQINKNKCVECGLCEKKCPVLNPFSSDCKNQKTYAVINYYDRKVSSSGGAFSIFARYVLNRGGVVYGATMSKDMKVFHIRVTSVEELSKLRGSKYLQSCIGTTYKEAKEDLRKGRTVLYSGTPCQIAGLYKFLGHSYGDLLITIDLVCHGVPNQKLFDTYIDKLLESHRIKKSEKNNIEFRFRKFDSWSIIPAVKFPESKWQVLYQEDNAYMSAFFESLLYRECCYKCSYSNLNRVGTFTIADFWGIGRHGKSFKKNVSSGVSLVLDNKGKMQDVISCTNELIYTEERSLEEAQAENWNLNYPVKRKIARNNAVADFLNENMSLQSFCVKYGLLEKKNLKYYLKKYSKSIIYFLGLYNMYKSISYKLGK